MYSYIYETVNKNKIKNYSFFVVQKTEHCILKQTKQGKKINKNRNVKYIYIYLCCNKYCAIWIWLGRPEIVMMRSFDPGRGSSIVIPAPESARILRILPPPLPIIAPANYKTIQRISKKLQPTSVKTLKLRIPFD